ncbi:MAG TPA: di-heme oxidoredictase family protein [Candidatus Acidoferrum sp.]|nr:di-heme oxidoredictase family protein [Candidatus Acidoferrum sp.]
MKITKLASVFACLLTLLLPGMAFAQSDPGVRSTTGVNAGQPLASVSANPNDLAFFQTGLVQFNEHQTVTGDNPGLGPRFNLDSCGACHSQPAPGGTSPASGVFPNIGPNPQSQVIANGLVSGSTNSIPYFVAANGPVREARFPFFFDRFGNPNPSAPNGGVEDLFTVSGRTDAGTCSLQQPSFNVARATNNIIFRIPTPTFGTGLMANIDDSTLLANQRAQRSNNLGISGTFNHNGNDGTISRFGWKAQNKSLMIFSGEAYNVEMGISNELFTQDRPLPGEDQSGSGLPSNCLNLAGTGYPEDITHSDGSTASAVTSDAGLFNTFMQFLDQPTPSTTLPGGAASIANGRKLFSAIGCALCHTPSLTTQASRLTAGLSNATANLLSDIEIHHMGAGLADNVSQGGAGGDQFRTAPLWGLGQRIFFLHDGRTADLLAAIEAHQSSGSEATQVEENFDSLTPSQKQDLLNFLRSL